MKDNTTEARRLLEQAIRVMPEDFALSEARHHIKIALNHIGQVEQKRVRRENVQRQNTTQPLFSGTASGGSANNIRESLQAIDDMIAGETKKLEDIQTRRQQRRTQTQVDDEGGGDLIRD